MMANVGVFALPGIRRRPAPVLLGGSDIAVAAKSPNQDLAKKAVALMLSDEYQTILAEAGLTPAKESLRRLLGDDEFAQATIAAAPTPSSPRPRRAGPASRARGSSRTCSSTSPRAVTSPSWPPLPTRRSTEQLNS